MQGHIDHTEDYDELKALITLSIEIALDCNKCTIQQPV